jgi:uncharacterized phage-associated protein
MYTANDIANWFLAGVDRAAGDSITHLKLQKLVYYAQAWSLALLDRPLFEEDFQAWTHGPVVPSLWRRFRDHGWEALPAPDDVLEFEPEVEELLRDVSNVHGEMSAHRLEELTHREDPWLVTRRGLSPELRCTASIPKQHMWEYYRSVYAKTDEQAE